MKKLITIAIIAFFCCAIITQTHILESLVAFWLVGAIPGTTLMMPPVVMLTIVFVTMWLVIFHTVIAPQVKLHAHRKQQKLVKKSA